jgi:hypothetical protein
MFSARAELLGASSCRRVMCGSVGEAVDVLLTERVPASYQL